MSAAELAKEITKLLASSHSNVPQVFELCNDAVTKEKKNEITGSYSRLMDRCEEYRTAACDLSCYLDSLHELWHQLIEEEELGAEMVRRMQAASSYASDLEDELGKIEDEYKDKVNARLHELDPEEYPEEEE